MNALWITRLCAYKNSPECLQSAHNLIALKIKRQNLLLQKFKAPSIALVGKEARSLQEILLREARAAKQFWNVFRTLLPDTTTFEGRKAHRDDPVNRLLDIGYHHLTNLVRKVLEQYQIPTDMGILHVAHKSDSAPLAYDLVEMFRSDIIDAEALRYFRLKKRPVEVTPKEIKKFLYRVNRRLDHVYYIEAFRGCQTYRYYIELQVLKFIKAVNHKMPFEPLYLPIRHENRCRLTAKKDMLPSPQEFLEILR